MKTSSAVVLELLVDTRSGERVLSLISLRALRSSGSNKS